MAAGDPWCSVHGQVPCNCAAGYTGPFYVIEYRATSFKPLFPPQTWPPTSPARISDEDVDRIARRMAELLDANLAGVRALHALVDLTDPNDPIGVALTKVGLGLKP